jgi:hypothetical protein
MSYDLVGALNAIAGTTGSDVAKAGVEAVNRIDQLRDRVAALELLGLTTRLQALEAKKTVTGGVASVSNGGTITHGLGGAPTLYSVTATVAGRRVAVTAVSATTLTVSLLDTAGLAVMAAENVAWVAGR